MPPLIKVRLSINNTFHTLGIYDSGSNISLINSRLLRLKNKKVDNIQCVNLTTINGVKKTNGLVNLKIRIHKIEKEVNVFVINEKNFNYDFLIGLDLIKSFKLKQDEELKITQSLADTISKEKNTDNESRNTILENEDENYKVPIPNRQVENYEIIPKTISSEKVKNKLEKCIVNFNDNFKQNNFRISENHLDCQQKTKIDTLMKKYDSIFAKNKYDIGTVKDYEARIDLSVEKYCCKRPYRCSIEDKKEIETQISKLLEKNLIEESYSPFAAPVTLAFKKEDNRRSRLCIDFRDLNKLVIPQPQPFPQIEDQNSS